MSTAVDITEADPNGAKCCGGCGGEWPCWKKFIYLGQSLPGDEDLTAEELQKALSSRPGKLYCPVCYVYQNCKKEIGILMGRFLTAQEKKILRKELSALERGESLEGRIFTQEEIKILKKKVAAGQRGEPQEVRGISQSHGRTQEVRGISQSHGRTQARTFEDAMSRTMPPPNFVPDRHRRQNTFGYPRSDVGGGRFSGPERSPSLSDVAIARGADEGYTPAHDKYVEARLQLLKRARANHSNGSTVYTAEVTVKSHERGSSKLKDIGLLINAVTHVPFRYGVRQLKQTLYTIVEGEWKAFSGGYPISIDDFEMGKEEKATSMSPMIALPDEDGVDSYCVCEGNGIRLDKKGKPDTSKKTVKIMFLLNARVYENFKFWDANGRNKDDDGNCVIIDVDSDSCPSEVSTHNSRKKGKGKGKGKAVTRIESEDDLSGSVAETPPPPSVAESSGKRQRATSTSTQAHVSPPRKRPLVGPSTIANNNSHASLTQTPLNVTQLRLALRNSQPPSKKEMKKLVTWEETKVDIRAGKLIDVNRLFELAGEKSCIAAYLESPIEDVTLLIELVSIRKPRYGAMKQTRTGKLPTPVEIGTFAGHRDVAVKQMTNRLKINDDVTIRTPYPGNLQREKLMPELMCATWANALLESTWQHVRTAAMVKGIPAFGVPNPAMRFVNVALAVEIGGTKNAFLLEELIDDRKQGVKFVKYISNKSATIILDDDDDRYTLRAEFLSFSQHHQYWATRKLAFISDYQGSLDLLTDPQIITHPKLGEIFASGNMSTAFWNFEKDHTCNRFCRYYELPTDYADWEDPFTEGEGEEGDDARRSASKNAGPSFTSMQISATG